MFKLYRKTVFPRWRHVNRQKSVDRNQNFSCPKALVICTTSHGKNYSNHNEKKQHADKQDKRCWNDPEFHFNFLHTSLFETAGWLGTAALYINYHLKHINNVLEYDGFKSSCLFSNIVLAMPKRSQKALSNVPNLTTLPQNVQNLEKDNISRKKVDLESIRNLNDQYAATVQNFVGVRNISKNDKKAFRSFQTAARLGSVRAFYNLGVCYQFGKGTKVNLNMAAFCYRKAALKGHGLASFNLAVFFLKGLGGLPIDYKLAKELLAQAAEKDVPEAQVYFGIKYLEEERWQDAVRIFTSLAEKNVPDGQYYLGLCYENGLGVEKNESIAIELFSKSAAHGEKKAALKLKYYEKKRKDARKTLVSTADKNRKKNSNLHVSTSVPELGTLVKQSNQSSTKVSILSHLDLITPFLVGDKCRDKDSFISDDKFTKEYSSILLPFRHISLVTVQVKT